MDAITLNLRVGRLPAASVASGGELSAAELDANFTNLKNAAEQLDAEKSPLAKWVSDTAPDPLLYSDWYTLDLRHFIRTDGVWVEEPGTSGQDGADGAAGAPAAIAKVTVSVVPAQFGQAEVSAAAVGALPTHTVLCQLVPNAEWDADDLSGLSVIGVAGTDAITFTIAGEGPIVGALAIAYQIG